MASPLGDQYMAAGGAAPPDSTHVDLVAQPHAPEPSSTRTHCPYCALQCGVRVTARDGRVAVSGDDDFAVNRGLLCVKGWTAGATLSHEERLTTPLVRDAQGRLAPASWDEAIGRAAAAFRETQARHGRDAVGVFGSGALTNEKAYAILAQAAALGCERALLRGLERSTTVCRGPKPAGALAAYRLPVSIRAGAPFTTHEVIEAIAPLQLRGRFVALLHYGEPNAALTTWLRGRGAEIWELLPYAWRMPENTAPLARLVDEVISGGVDAIAFTSQVQVRHLWEVAGPARTDALREALNRCGAVGAIGPTCAAALEATGVPPTVVASPPKLSTLLLAMADAVERAGQANGVGRV